MVPKITDFGLAKRLEEHTVQGETNAIVGTPAYMAPEQATGLVHTVGPAADVYALGVILYETLTGRLPFRGASSLEVLDQVRSTEPPPPRRWQPSIPADLEVICLKCLRKGPSERYASAEALADDLRRFRNHEPIRARPTPARERLVKWVRRRPTEAALVAVSVLAAVALLVLGVWSNVRLREAADRAEARSRLARRAADDMYTQVAEKWLADEPEKDAVQREFLEKALALYEELAAESPSDPALRHEQGLAWFRVGQIARELGQHERAETAYQHALALQQALNSQFPDSADYRQDLAITHNWRGELLRASGQRLADAEQEFLTALALQQGLIEEFPSSPIYRKEAARSHYNLGLVRMETGRPREAEADCGQAIEALARLREQNPGNPDYRHELARSHLNRGVLREQRGQSREAEADYDEAFRLLKELAGQYPSRPGYRYELAVGTTNRANLLLGDPARRPAAEAGLRQALELFTRLAADFPDKPRYRYELANCLNSLASVCAYDPQRRGEAEQLWRQSLDALNDLAARSPNVADYRYGVGRAHGNLGWLHLQRKEPERARSHLEQGREHLEAARQLQPGSPTYAQALHDVYQNLAEAQVQLGDHAAALTSAAALLETSRASGPDDSYLAACFAARSLTAVRTDSRLAAAERPALERRHAEQALAWLREAVRRGYRDARTLATDDRLRPLRDEPDFRRLVQDLEDKQHER